MGWTTPRTWVAGEKPTAAVMNAHIRDNLKALNGFVLKTSDESVTSSATLQNDNELLYSIDATGTYVFDLAIFYSAASAGDIKLGFTFPTGTLHFGGMGPNNAGFTTGSNGPGEYIARNGAVSGTTNIPWAGSDTASMVLFGTLHGILIATATGTLQLQWAQNASSGTATKILLGSHMLVQQVA